ncbi:protein tyrosine phosphatase (PTP) superfamily phosphohydrolase (DUF442 family) [Bartonella doshiae]|uniref:Uncharacterized protein n=2 Tax=Bartonella doshiae TaxID=33044 RepID=A0A380ZH06_BARDO|nr:hypothetical protein MCS_01512 [Bartonella doshiae NCTC 12862 = ATCC 700133]MBB6159866.1 protein tyrosine phosphatase (PTP) superfamily phosphohydrolase (DUF442 family) [Bartonella doshiae]SUV45455.1 Uncharacterised protein [Bartonella doshiae]
MALFCTVETIELNLFKSSAMFLKFCKSGTSNVFIYKNIGPFTAQYSHDEVCIKEGEIR